MMRRLHADELARSESQPVHSASPSPQLEQARRRAASVASSLRSFMRDELALTDEQVADFELQLERALLLSLRAAP